MSAAAVTRAALLRQAARVLQARWPQLQATFRAEALPVTGMPPGMIGYRARFDWPGVVGLADDNTGEPIARSIPGKPEDPDAWILALDHQARRP